MKMKKIRLPSRFVRIDRVAGTVATRGKKGRFKGRKKVKGLGDKTLTRRVLRDIDLNKDGKPEYFGGTIMGRTKKKVRVRASKRAKAYERRI